MPWKLCSLAHMQKLKGGKVSLPRLMPPCLDTGKPFLDSTHAPTHAQPLLSPTHEYGQEEEERWVGATGMMAKEMMGHQRCSAFVRAMRGVCIECVLHAYRFELLYCLYRLYGLCVYCMYTGLS